jgi:hypothetical protein
MSLVQLVSVRKLPRVSTVVSVVALCISVSAAWYAHRARENYEKAAVAREQVGLARVGQNSPSNCERVLNDLGAGVVYFQRTAGGTWSVVTGAHAVEAAQAMCNGSRDIRVMPAGATSP